MRRLTRLKERRKRIKKLMLSSILYVGIIGGACALGIGIVHYFFNPTTPAVTQEKDDDPSTKRSETNNENAGNSDEDSNQESDEMTQNSDEENNGEDTSANNSEDGSWEPVGTTQEEPHQTSFDEESVDWEEMKTALSVAINVEKSNMSLWWIGNDGGPDRSFGIVSPRGTEHYQRVSIVWVTNKGWKPTHVRAVTEEEYKQYIEKYVNN